MCWCPSNDSLSPFGFLMQASTWKKHSSCGTSSFFPMTKNPQQWLQVVGHAGLFPLSCTLLLSCATSVLKKQYSITCCLFGACLTGSFRVGDYGTLLKKFCEGERQCYLRLMEDALRPFVPAYHGMVQLDELEYNMMDNLLTHFSMPAVMDCKMGSR